MEGVQPVVLKRRFRKVFRCVVLLVIDVPFVDCREVKSLFASLLKWCEISVVRHPLVHFVRHGVGEGVLIRRLQSVDYPTIIFCSLDHDYRAAPASHFE